MGKLVFPAKPGPDEYDAYYKNYIDRMGDSNPLKCLKSDFYEQIELLDHSPGLDLDYAYDHGKWTLRQLILHLIDCERVMSWRLLAAARNDPNSYPGYDYEWYAKNTIDDAREWVELRGEWKSVRKAVVAFAETLDEDQWRRFCTIDGKKLSARAILYIITGHVRTHFVTIQNKYLP